MKYPNLKEEKKLWKKGYKYVAGLDESGRGSLAGPVVAAAVSIDPRSCADLAVNVREFSEIKDSKKLSPKKREKIYKSIIRNPNIKWGIGVISSKRIDKINILEATKLAMEKATKNLEYRSWNLGYKKLKVEFLILDGKMKLNLSIKQKSIVRADEKVLSCAMASIIAKVKRDRIMIKEHKNYPQYGFDKHKGYGVKYHIRMLKKDGFSKIHRKSFKVKRLSKLRD